MKQKLPYLFFFFFLTIILAACQQENEEITPINKEETVSVSDDVFNLIRRITLLDGSIDDVLDNANCFQLVLPVTVFIDSQSVTVESLADTAMVVNTLKIQGLTSSNIKFEYPLEIILPDYSVVEIDNANELLSFKDQCISDGSDEDIECVDFKYPILVYAYNRNDETPFNDLINSDYDFNVFLSRLNNKDILSLEYPLQLLANSNSKTVNNNSTLQNVINANIDTCDEHDQYIFNPAGTEFIKLLTSMDWQISFFYDKEDLTGHVNDAALDFIVDGTVVSGQQRGEWNEKKENGSLFLDFDFDSDFELDLIDREWNVFSYSSKEIILQHRSGGTTSSEYLVLRQEIRNNPLEGVLKNGLWQVSSFIDEGDDETGEFTQYDFGFENKGELNITDSTDNFVAKWYTVSESFLVLDIDESPLNDLRNDWQVSSYDSLKIQLMDPESQSELVLSRK